MTSIMGICSPIYLAQQLNPIGEGVEAVDEEAAAIGEQVRHIGEDDRSNENKSYRRD